MQQIVDQLSETIRAAGAAKQPLRIRGGGTKDFYGGALQGEVLDTRAYSGIVDYEPTELVITARAGTPVGEIEAAMLERNQMLAFEPPRFGDDSTIGGCIGAGLSGPRRPYAGSARDLVLGVRMLDGRGADLRFGGQVMKNVAGYDASRLMVGALGTLGVVLEVSLKALPLPAANATVRREHTQAHAIVLMNQWAAKPLPITATCYTEGALYIRLSGAQSAVRSARERLGGEEVPGAEFFWQQVRDQEHELFRSATALWRMSIKPTADPFAFEGPQLIEWNGALRWIAADLDPGAAREAAVQAGGHATLFRGGDKRAGVFHPLTAPMSALHRRIKDAFDPHGILNAGRLYDGL